MKIINKIKSILNIKNLFLALVVILIACFFISKKENLDLDELYTYGLSNSSFQLLIEDYKEYTGENLLLDYASVKNDNKFDFANVYENQSKDTHPPIYYLLVHIISSFNSGNFSIWYGLSINVFFLIFLFFAMKYLFYILIKDEKMSIFLTLISFFTYGFINKIIFTRMYVMLSTISLIFIILIINKTNNLTKTNNIKTFFNDNLKFLLIFFITCIIGILTHYHFALVAMFFSIYFGIHLIKEKNYHLLFATILTGILSLIISYLIFPSMLSHLFSSGSLHSFTQNEKVNFLESLYTYIEIIYKAFFGKGIFVYILVLIILLILNHKNKSDFPKKIYFTFLSFAIFYFITIIFTSTFSFIRYLYNIFPVIILLLLTPIYYLSKNIKPIFKYFSIIMIIILCATSNLNEKPMSLNSGDNTFKEFLDTNKNVKTIMLYRSADENNNMSSMVGTSLWKLPRPLYLFRDMQNIIFIDTSKENAFDNSKSSITNNDDLFVVIYTTNNQDENQLLSELINLNNTKRINKIYFTNYIHVYRLTLY